MKSMFVASVFLLSGWLTLAANAQEDHQHGKMSAEKAAELELLWQRTSVERAANRALHESMERDKEIDKKRNLAFTNSPASLRMLHAFSQNSEVFKGLEVVDDQKGSLKELLKESEALDKEFEEELAKADSKAEKSEIRFRFMQKKREVVLKVRSILVNFQMEDLGANVLGANSLLSILSEETLMSRHLEITDEQKKKLVKEANKQAEELRELILEKRLDACRAFSNVLTDKQRRELINIYGAEGLDESFSFSTPVKLYKSLVDDPENKRFTELIDFWKSFKK